MSNMLKTILFVVLMFGKQKETTEAHVYCQDAHATDWTPLGYSCPVICASVVEAVRKLRETEFNEWISIRQSQLLANFFNVTELKPKRVTAKTKKPIKPKYKPEHKPESEDDYLFEQAPRSSDDFDDIDPLKLRNDIEKPELTNAHLVAVHKLLMNKETGSELQMIFKLASNKLNQSCRRKIGGGKKSFECARRAATAQEDAVKQLTAVLNKHSTDTYFTYDMGKDLLTRVLESSTNLAVGKFDVNRIVKRLSSILSEQNDDTKILPKHVTLKSKFCLNLYVPGCFCLPGFVEKEGQCVRPEDCFEDPTPNLHFIKRITIE